MAEVLQVPQNRVRVIGAYLGGGFGGKEDVTVEVYLGLLALKTGRPVKMVWTRQESLLARAKRHSYRMRYRTGAAASGEIVAQQIELLGDAGAYAYLSALVLLYSTVTAAGPYRVPNVEVQARVAYTNNPPTSAMRGFGGMQTVFAYESQMDRVARALGLGPIEVRRVNALRRGDSLPVGQVIETHVALPELCERAWTALEPPTPPRAPHVRVGRGLACNLQPYGRIVWLHDWSSAWVGFEMDASLVVRCGVPDVGGGQASSLCQIAAEVLGVSLDRVSVHISDSALTPLAGTTTASRQLYMSGNAVLKASRELRDQLLGVAAAMLDADAAMLVESWLKKISVGVHTGTTVHKIEDAGGRKRVSLSNGTSLDVDLVIVATGIRPNIDLVQGSGIQTDQAILVNDRMQTNFAHIYAAGDVARWHNPRFGISMRVEHRTNATEQGTTVVTEEPSSRRFAWANANASSHAAWAVAAARGGKSYGFKEAVLSKYIEVTTALIDEQYLVEALHEIGYEPEVCREGRALVGYMGDERAERAQIIV